MGILIVAEGKIKLSLISPEQRKTLLDKFYRFLKPGGRVLLDVHTVNT